MSDRSNKPSFAVFRNLKHAKYHFSEALTDKLTESSNTTPNSVSTSTWVCVTSNISTSHKTWQTSLLFLELLQIQNQKRKSGGTLHIMSPPPEKVGGHVPRVPHQIAPMLATLLGLLDAPSDSASQWFDPLVTALKPVVSKYCWLLNQDLSFHSN